MGIVNENLDFDQGTVERLLFRQLATDKKYLSVVSEDFDRRWFQQEDLGDLSMACIKYFKKYGRPPKVNEVKYLAKRLVDGGRMKMSVNDAYYLVDSCLSTQYDVPKDVLEKNLDFFIRLRSTWCMVMDNVDNMEKNVDGVIEEFMRRTEHISKLSLMDHDFGMDYFADDAMENHWKYILNPAARVSTGWAGLDKYISGGLLRDGRSLYIFMGQAGLGKSLYLSNLTVNLLRQGLSVPLITLEMSEDVYAQRFDAHISGQNINQLNRNADVARENIRKFFADHPEARLFIKEYPPRTVRVSDIEAYLDGLLEAGHRIDAIVVDYLNLVLPRHQTDSMYAGVQEVSEQLRALSYKYNAPVLTATQANRAGMNNENIGMENVSESSGIAHTCDLLIGLFQTPEDREDGVIKARVLKNRLGGRVGKVLTFELNPHNLTLNDITDSETLEVGSGDTSRAVMSSIPDRREVQSSDFDDAMDDVM